MQSSAGSQESRLSLPWACQLCPCEDGAGQGIIGAWHHGGVASWGRGVAGVWHPQLLQESLLSSDFLGRRGRGSWLVLQPVAVGCGVRALPRTPGGKAVSRHGLLGHSSPAPDQPLSPAPPQNKPILCCLSPGAHSYPWICGLSAVPLLTACPRPVPCILIAG